MDSQVDKPLIVAFVADLFFAVKIESAAEQGGFAVRWIESTDEFGPEDPRTPSRQLGEHLVGRGAKLLEQLTRWNPALAIFDLNNDQVPWEAWIMLITSVPATRRIPVLCFGSHMDVEVMLAASKAGADIVLARSRFVTELPELLKKHARTLDPEEIAVTCELPLSEKAIRGLEEFNRGEFYEAHEHLEEAWMEDGSLGRDLYRGVLQVGVAYYHIKEKNFKGAAKLFLRLRQWLDPLPDICRGIEVAQLRADAEVAHQRLLDLGPDRIAEFDLSLLRPVRYVAPDQPRKD